MNTSREFWIQFDGDPRHDDVAMHRIVYGGKHDADIPGVDTVHVIEKSAYDLVKGKLDLLHEFYSEGFEKQAAKLDVAIEALEFYSDNANIQFDMPYEFTDKGEQLLGTKAKEALAKIKEG